MKKEYDFSNAKQGKWIVWRLTNDITGANLILD